MDEVDDIMKLVQLHMN